MVTILHKDLVGVCLVPSAVLNEFSQGMSLLLMIYVFFTFFTILMSFSQ